MDATRGIMSGTMDRFKIVNKLSLLNFLIFSSVIVCLFSFWLMAQCLNSGLVTVLGT